MNTTIKLRLVQKGRQAILTGTVQGASLVAMSVIVPHPPAWYRRMERRRGIFSNGESRLTFFKTHTNEWMDTQHMRIWRIKK